MAKEIEIRFEDAPNHAYTLMGKAIEDHFPELVNASILILMDLKKRVADSGNKIVLGRMTRTNDLARHLTIDESGSESGYDYIMYLDKLMWNNISNPDRMRVIRHELRHTQQVGDKYGLRDHTIEDFHSEVFLNNDDPRWRERVGLVLEAKYDNISESRKSALATKEGEK